MINDMLRNPRADPGATANNNPLGAGGLAGVASFFKSPSIKIYKDHQKYQEWEFIFDLKSQQGTPGQQTGAQVGTPAGQPSAPGLTGLPQVPTPPAGPGTAK
jgi:hypothetical protein